MIRERQIKISLRLYYTPVRMAKLKTSTKNVGQDVQKEEHSSIAGGIAKWYNHSGNNSEDST